MSKQIILTCDCCGNMIKGDFELGPVHLILRGRESVSKYAKNFVGSNQDICYQCNLKLIKAVEKFCEEFSFND